HAGEPGGSRMGRTVSARGRANAGQCDRHRAALCGSDCPGHRRGRLDRSLTPRKEQEKNAMSVEIFGEEFPGLYFEDIGLNFTSKYVEEHFPAIWKRAYTKHYDAPGSHAGFKAPATLMSMCAISVEQHMKKGDSVPTTSLAAAGELEKYDYPTYYVGRELFHAMQHTHPPKGMLWSEVFFPYPGMIFMLPNGALHNEDGSPITFLCIAKLLYGKIMRAGLIDVRLPWGKAIDHETQELDRI